MYYKWLLLLVLFMGILNITHATQKVDFIVAKIGREVLLYSDVQRQKLQLQSAKMWNDQITEDMLLTDMVESEMIVQKARELNVRIDERQIKASAEQQITQIQSQFPSTRDFYRELRAAGLTVPELRKHYEDQIANQQLKERLIQSEIRSKINITDSDIYNYFHSEAAKIPLKDESFEVAMILRMPRVSSETDRIAHNKINEVRSRLQKGEDFARLARQYSEDGSASGGGDLGYFTRGQMIKEFEDVAFNTGINEVSGIVKTQFGYHIIRVTDKTEDQVRASHILVMVKETDDDIERERSFMMNLRQHLLNGEDFSKLATEYSHDTESQKEAGVIGILTKGEFPQWFSDKLQELQVGDISDVLEYQNMFYLFKLNANFPPRPMEYEEVRESLRAELNRQRQMELYEQWMADMKKEMFVVMYLERLDNTN